MYTNGLAYSGARPSVGIVMFNISRPYMYTETTLEELNRYWIQFELWDLYHYSDWAKPAAEKYINIMRYFGGYDRFIFM